MRPHAQSGTIPSTILRITVVPRIIITRLALIITSKSCEAAAHLVLDTDTQLIARRAARTRLVGVSDTSVAFGAAVSVCSTTAADLMRLGRLRRLS